MAELSADSLGTPYRMCQASPAEKKGCLVRQLVCKPHQKPCIPKLVQVRAVGGGPDPCKAMPTLKESFETREGGASRCAELRALNMGELAGCPAAPSLEPPPTPPLPRRASKRKSARSWGRGSSLCSWR